MMIVKIFICLAAGVIPLAAGSHMYPWGTEKDTSPFLSADGSFHKDDLEGVYKFFGATYETEIWLNANGNLAFDALNSYYFAEDFPFVMPYDFVGSVMISAFWSDFDLTKGGDVYIRECNENTEPDLIDLATRDVRTYFPCANEFSATHVIVATWVDAEHYHYYTYTYTGKRVKRDFVFNPDRNSFQVVIITNGEETFVLFIYEIIAWVNRDYESTWFFPAGVGFNAGDGVRFWVHPDSHTPDIIDVEETTNVGIPSIWAFKVDGEEILEPEDHTCGVPCYTCQEMQVSGDGAAADAACNAGGAVVCPAGEICFTKMRCRKQGRPGRILISKECRAPGSQPLDSLPAVFGSVNKNGNYVTREFCGDDNCNCDGGARLWSVLNTYTNNCAASSP